MPDVFHGSVHTISIQSYESTDDSPDDLCRRAERSMRGLGASGALQHCSIRAAELPSKLSFLYSRFHTVAHSDANASHGSPVNRHTVDFHAVDHRALNQCTNSHAANRRTNEASSRDSDLYAGNAMPEVSSKACALLLACLAV
jgi:hypothetical protein